MGRRSMEFKCLLIETTDGVATLTINSPRTLNALNSHILGELECALYELNPTLMSRL